MRITSRARATGSTLIEAMIALAILAIGLAGFSTSMVASARQDRRNTARAAAQTMADELARTMATWSFLDPRLSLSTQYAGTQFSQLVVADNFTVTPAVGTVTPATITETLTPVPNHTDAELIPGLPTEPKYGGRVTTDSNLFGPGRTYVFRSYWNVSLAPGNPTLKLIAIHVTYSISSTKRGVVTSFTSVMDRAALINRIAE